MIITNLLVSHFRNQIQNKAFPLKRVHFCHSSQHTERKGDFTSLGNLSFTRLLSPVLNSGTLVPNCYLSLEVQTGWIDFQVLPVLAGLILMPYPGTDAHDS